MAPECDPTTFASLGYAVVRGAMSKDELALLREDFATRPPGVVRQLPSNSGDKKTFVLTAASHAACEALSARLVAIARSVCPPVDLVTHAHYFHSKVVDFDVLHSDLEPFWMFHDPVHYLNLWIPFVKPDPQRSGLEVVPFDALRRALPEAVAARLAGPESGCHEVSERGAGSLLRDLSTGQASESDVNVRALAVCPSLVPGDVLVFRGDVLHRTQDATTDRVSASFRLIDGTQELAWSDFASGCAAKIEMMARTEPYVRAAARFINEGRKPLALREVARAAFDVDLPPDPAAAAALRAMIPPEGRPAV